MSARASSSRPSLTSTIARHFSREGLGRPKNSNAAKASSGLPTRNKVMPRTQLCHCGLAGLRSVAIARCRSASSWSPKVASMVLEIRYSSASLGLSEIARAM